MVLRGGQDVGPANLEHNFVGVVRAYVCVCMYAQQCSLACARARGVGLHVRMCWRACTRAGPGANATGHFTHAFSLKRLARSDARAASGGNTRNVAGRLAAAVDAQNGIDMVGVGGLLEGARSSVIEARKA